MKPDSVIIFNCNDKYELKLKEYLTEKNIIINEIDYVDDKFDIDNYYICVLKNQYLIGKIAQSINVDVSDAGYDKKDEKLYKYR